MDPGRTLRRRYVLERELGRGGISVVFAGRDHVLEREVAIKLLNDEDNRPLFESQLRREARLVAGLDHPGIVPVFDFGRDQELLFLIMPLLQGRTLAELLTAGPLPIPLAAEIARQVALALAHSHGHDVVHRDVKPASVMLVRDDDRLRVKLMDFGLAELVGRTLRPRFIRDQANPLIGTLPYVSPEQVRGDPPSPRSDLYALGAVLYEALVGRPLFAGEPKAMLEAVAETTPTRPGLLRTGLPTELESLILALLTKEPARRPGNGREVAELLEPYADATDAISLLGPQASSGLGPASLGLESGDARGPGLHDAVGRDPILRTIDSRLITARAGAQQLVLIAGEAGIGKTTLLDELALACQQREIELLRTSATANAHGGWLGPFSELLTAGLAQRPEAVELLTADAARLVALFPDLARSRLGHLAHAPKRESSWAGLERVDERERPRVTHERESEHARANGSKTAKLSAGAKSSRERTENLLVRAFAALVANRRPLTLAIDDAHFSSEAVELVDLLFRRLPRAPLVFVLAYERAELGDQHPLSRLELRLAQHPRALSLSLGPLDEDIHSALMTQLLGGGLPAPGLAEQLFRESGGRPLYARELVRTAVDAGILVRRDHIWRLELAGWPIPRSIRAALVSRLRRLPTTLFCALRTGSVLAVDGGSFDFDELVELVGRSPSELEHLLAHAVERDLVTEVRGGGRITLRFTSELLRRVIHDELPSAARHKLHLHCAERLLRLPFSEDHVEDRERMRVAHLIEGNAVAEARPLVVAHAQQALEDGRTDPALDQLTKLLELSDSLAVVERAELLLLLAELELVNDETHAALAALRRLASILDHGDEARLARLGERGAELAKQLGHRSLADRLLGLRPRDRRAAERQRRARAELAALRPATSSRSMQIGDLLLMHGEYTAAREAYDNSRRRAASEGDRDEEARQLQKLARVASKLGHYETAIAYCREGLELLAGKHSLERVGLWALAAFAHCEARRHELAEAELEAGSAELATFPSQRGPDRDRVAAELERSRGNWRIASGDAEAAIEAYERCLVLHPPTDRWNVSIARFHLGQACALAGHASRALRELERAAADKRAIGDRWGLAYAEAARVQVLRDLGRIEDASEALDGARELADEVEDPRLFTLVHTELGRHALLSGRLEVAAQEARRAKDVARRTGASAELGAAHELLATIDLARDEPAEARRHASEAVDTAQAQELDGLLIGALLVLAEASSPERRPELLDRARAACESLGNPYRELDVSLTSLRLGLGDPNHASDDYVALEQLSDRAEKLSAQRHVGLCLLAQAEVLAPHDLRGALDHARLGEAQLRVLGATLEADRAAELIARLTLR
ncbi:Serine/threonine-protein kinase PrkC [Enhygromyxa salina]|uniref:non-specific serine/threonine protein kinase n=1 Tax=Enhygromyxa salina TaxID=215803 RepID=A0A2S9XUR2_9BACT|nr:protein kinase [Enhygromyxa salina]PRP96583.1 Serine/threonine-protein kinase PrkC [Enhygromyxa salina]